MAQFSLTGASSTSEGTLQTLLTGSGEISVIQSQTLSGAYIVILGGTSAVASDTWDGSIYAPTILTDDRMNSLGYAMFFVGGSTPISLDHDAYVAVPTDLRTGTLVTVFEPSTTHEYAPLVSTRVHDGLVVFQTRSLGTFLVRQGRSSVPPSPVPSIVASETPVPPTFSDIDDSFARSDIEALSASGIVSGYPDGTFRPDAPASRAEFLKMAFYGLSIPVVDTSTTIFTDVTEPWQIPLVEEARQLGIVSGQQADDGTYAFRPDDPITRAELAKMLVRTITLTSH